MKAGMMGKVAEDVIEVVYTVKRMRKYATTMYKRWMV